MKTTLIAFVVSILFLACDSKPKVIEAVDISPATDQPAADASATQLHKVTINEILHTSRYTYLNVTEEAEPFWIAIPRKDDVEQGATYYYRGGLKKTNFESTEHNRVFDVVYLVSGISKDAGMNDMGTSPHGAMSSGGEPDLEQNTKLDPPPGGITIAELLKNKSKYDGQTVRVRGRCIKLNNMIMNRNWIHLNDGSMGDEKADLTITTTDIVQLGSVVAFEGKITLNKDFGAGYKYDIIMEEASLLQ